MKEFPDRCPECGERCQYCSGQADGNQQEIPIQSYRPQDGDALVLKVNHQLSQEQVDRIKVAFEQPWSGKVMILEDGWDLKVLRGQQPGPIPESIASQQARAGYVD